MTSDHEIPVQPNVNRDPQGDLREKVTQVVRQMDFAELWSPDLNKRICALFPAMREDHTGMMSLISYQCRWEEERRRTTARVDEAAGLHEIFRSVECDELSLTLAAVPKLLIARATQ